MDLSKKIKEARTKLGFSQAQAAKAWDVPKQTLLNWEHGRNTPRGLALKMLNGILDAILFPPIMEETFALGAAAPSMEDVEDNTPSASSVSPDSLAAAPAAASKLRGKKSPPKSKRRRRSA